MPRPSRKPLKRHRLIRLCVEKLIPAPAVRIWVYIAIAPGADIMTLMPIPLWDEWMASRNDKTQWEAVEKRLARSQCVEASMWMGSDSIATENLGGMVSIKANGYGTMGYRFCQVLPSVEAVNLFAGYIFQPVWAPAAAWEQAAAYIEKQGAKGLAPVLREFIGILDWDQFPPPKGKR